MAQAAFIDWGEFGIVFSKPRLKKIPTPSDRANSARFDITRSRPQLLCAAIFKHLKGTFSKNCSKECLSGLADSEGITKATKQDGAHVRRIHAGPLQRVSGILERK